MNGGISHWKHIDVDGTVTPTACGIQPIRPDHPALRKANHPSTATLTVAGQHVAIAYAVRWPNDLYFSTEPTACSHVGIATRASLAILPSEWHLEGGWFGAGVNGSGGLRVATGAKGTSSDGPTIALTLSGSSTSQGYTVEGSGTIEALDCPN